MNSKEIRSLIKAAINDTVWNDKLSVDYVWGQLRHDYPDEFCPKTTSTVEDIRANWTTYRNLNDWFSQNKQPLIDSGLFKDEKMKLPNGDIS